MVASMFLTIIGVTLISKPSFLFQGLDTSVNHSSYNKSLLQETNDHEIISTFEVQIGNAY